MANRELRERLRRLPAVENELAGAKARIAELEAELERLRPLGEAVEKMVGRHWALCAPLWPTDGDVWGIMDGYTRQVFAEGDTPKAAIDAALRVAKGDA